MRIAASILAADPLRLGDEVHRLIDGGINTIHIDIMDGHMVPNLGLSPAVIKSLAKKHPELYLDVHLMVNNYVEWIERLIDTGIKSISFHPTIKDPGSNLAMLKKFVNRGVSIGIVLDPDDTPLLVDEYIHLIDFILIMGVYPGFGGQKQIASTASLIKSTKDMYPDIEIRVDGGVTPENSKNCIESGAGFLVVGSFFTRCDSIKKAIDELIN